MEASNDRVRGQERAKDHHLDESRSQHLVIEEAAQTWFPWIPVRQDSFVFNFSKIVHLFKITTTTKKKITAVASFGLCLLCVQSKSCPSTLGHVEGTRDGGKPGLPLTPSNKTIIQNIKQSGFLTNNIGGKRHQHLKFSLKILY